MIIVIKDAAMAKDANVYVKVGPLWIQRKAFRASLKMTTATIFMQCQILQVKISIFHYNT